MNSQGYLFVGGPADGDVKVTHGYSPIATCVRDDRIPKPGVEPDKMINIKTVLYVLTRIRADGRDFEFYRLTTMTDADAIALLLTNYLSNPRR